jgi:putative ABC transport system permease protein
MRAVPPAEVPPAAGTFAVAAAVAGGIARHRVQTAVIALVLMIATTTCVLAVALVVDADGPFDKAFAAQRGAHLMVTVDTARTTAAELAGTTRLPQVTAAAGPFAEVAVRASVSGGPRGGEPMPFTETLAGRGSPGGPVDEIALRSGHWPRQPGQIVLGSTWPGVPEFVPLGATVTVTGVPGAPVLTVVGFATSVTQSADGWVLPADIARLRAPGTPSSAQLLYRFGSASTAGQVGADAAAVNAALPAGAVTGTQSYLAVRAAEASEIAPYVPFVVVFGVIGIVLSALIVANVVSGAVTAGWRRIGILKSIGFTPGQVVTAYVGQALVPAALGCLAGVLLGGLLAGRLVLAKTAAAFGVGELGGVPGWVDLTAPAALCALTGIAGLLPAWRAGRLTAVAAIAAGRAPRAGRGRAAHRLLGRLMLPRPVTIGLAAPFARPARTAATLAVIGLGATAVSVTAGLEPSLIRIENGSSLVNTVQVIAASPPRVNPSDPGAGRQPGAPFPASTQRAIEGAIRGRPSTLHYVAEAHLTASVAGLGQVPVTAFRGDASWLGCPMVSGHWYSGPGQVDVTLGFLQAAGKKVGDTITISYAGHRTTARIAGDVFDPGGDGISILTSWPTLAGVDPDLAPDSYAIGLRPGTNAWGYAHSFGLRSAPSRQFETGVNDTGPIFPQVIILIGSLMSLLVIAAALGVVSTVVMATRERARDLGIFKAVGMTPWQAVATVSCWVAGTGLVAGLVAVTAGITLHRYLIPLMAVFNGNGVPASFLNVYGGWEIAGLVLAGPAIAVAGALLPAGWATRIPAAAVLRAE